MDKHFNHRIWEDRLYDLWEKSGCFSPKKHKDAEAFSIIMPPPNANDPLHIGHALFLTLQDILIRYQRMKGKISLWLPGTDHAGIETQYVFEKKLAKEGKSRFDFDRETLYRMIWDYVKQNSGVAVYQMKKLGASADWKRFKFTLDDDVVEFVLETFVRMYKEGMVYRGERVINYCTFCGTGFSELEVESKEKLGELYFIKYGPLQVATTRPETVFGDIAVAVNPKDERYKDYIGKEITIDTLLGKKQLPVIADELVEKDFGTGVVKITPYHDFTDYEIWQKHKNELPIPKRVIDYDGRLNENCGDYAGLSLSQARQKVVADLQEKNLIIKIVKNHKMMVGTCYRCKRIIEPLPLPQFFVKTKPLAERVLKVLKNKEVKIIGKGWDKILRNWLENIKDWNISRQIVWGIRMPVWYPIKADNNRIHVSFVNKKRELVEGELGELLDKYELKDIQGGLQKIRAPVDAEFIVSVKKPGVNFIQETDTFDTWFSSSQWPVVTLKTNKKGDFEFFYPTTVMETAYDILTRWVMRMLLVCIYLTDKIPFEYVYLHGLIRDEFGRKMSKSVGNVINPLDVIESYGADALRMALVMGTVAGRDNNVGENKIRGMRNFSNKIWNAGRYLYAASETKNLGKHDKSFDRKISYIIKRTTELLDNFRIGLAAEYLYKEFWHWYCDVCIEKQKRNELTYKQLRKGMNVFLRLLHPFVPYTTEAVWQELFAKNDTDLLMLASWPKTE